ncbi:MAG: TIGR01212 family radical SAM protein [Bacteroidales bacterium]|nr:TIGR01212 family radical SAM protein [Bacteroidales bacterium]
MIYSWGDSRRFNSYSNYFKKIFDTRVQKLSVDAGFTCPNRDGSISRGGCTYCNNNAFNPSYCSPYKTIKQQLSEGVEFHRKRYRRAKKYLAYFQPYSNTYANVKYLKKIYQQALDFSGVIGLVIGTRPDCIDDEKLKYLKEISENYYLIIEYGVESCYNKTLKRVNRGHSFEKSVEIIKKTADYGINVGAHFIFGLPGETRQEIFEQHKIISQLPIKTIKFHQLQILKDTQMEFEYKKNPGDFNFFSLDEYIDFVVNFIEYLNPEIVIERFAGEVPPRFIAGPTWGNIRNDQILNRIEKKLEEKNTWQGKYYSS